MVTKLPKINTLVIKQEEGGNFFIAAPNVLVIDIFGMSMLIKFMVMNGFLSRKVLEGILEECVDAKI